MSMLLVVCTVAEPKTMNESSVDYLYITGEQVDAKEEI
jgi:hypothetical protein